MTVVRSTGAFYGTSESSFGTAIGSSAAVFTAGTEQDLLGNASSEGWIRLYLAFKYTTAPTVGSIDIKCYPSRISGTPAVDAAPLVFSFGVTASNITSNVAQIQYIGDLKASRFMTGAISNNGTSQSGSFSLLYELFAES